MKKIRNSAIIVLLSSLMVVTSCIEGELYTPDIFKEVEEDDDNQPAFHFVGNGKPEDLFKEDSEGSAIAENGDEYSDSYLYVESVDNETGERMEVTFYVPVPSWEEKVYMISAKEPGENIPENSSELMIELEVLWTDENGITELYSNFLEDSSILPVTIGVNTIKEVKTQDEEGNDVITRYMSGYFSGTLKNEDGTKDLKITYGIFENIPIS